MKTNVTYEKAMREKAIAQQKGLYTLQLINASKKPGKLGGSITMQGPADPEEEEMVRDFMLTLMEHRAAKAPPASP